MEEAKVKLEGAYKEFQDNREDLKSKMETMAPEKIVIEEYPTYLVDITLVLFALPPSQVSVERIFSLLRLYKSDLRNRLKADILNDCIFLKANKCLRLKSTR